MKNFKKILAIFIMLFLLNSCFGYKIVKEDDIKKQEKVKEKTTYKPGTLGAILHRDEIENQEEENHPSSSTSLEKGRENNEEKIDENLDKKDDEKNKEEEKTLEKNNFNYSELSKISEFGEAVVRGDGVVSKVNYNLFVKKENFDIDIENFEENAKEFFSYHDDDETPDLTKYIKDKYNIFYRNTARTLPKKAGFTFFVIHAEGKNYVYEKHYVDLEHNLHGILFLDKGPLEKAENLTEKLESLKAKNKELKEMNSNFSEIDTTNMVFKKLLN